MGPYALLLVAVSRVAAGGLTAVDDACSLNGALVGGACACTRAWVGAACSRLALRRR